jgi:hypothetical protein
MGKPNCGGLGKPLGQGEGEPNDIFPQKSVALAPDRLIIACAFGKGIVRDIFKNNAAKLARMVTTNRVELHTLMSHAKPAQAPAAKK